MKKVITLVLVAGLGCACATTLTGRVIEINSSFQQVPVTDVTVKVTGTSLQTTSDSQGYFTLTGVPGNSSGISLRTRKTGYVDTYTQPFGIGSAEQTNFNAMIFSSSFHTGFIHRTGAPAHINDKGDIVGRVYDNQNNAISGVIISARYVDNNSEITSIRYFDNLGNPVTGSTRDNGLFCIYNVDKERAIKITATKQGYFFNCPLVVGYSNSITVAGVETVNPISVSGQTIWDEKPVGNVTISLPGTTLTTTSNSNGQFTSNNVSPWSFYFVKTAKTNYKDLYMLGFIEEEENVTDAELMVLPVDAYNQVMSAIGQSHIWGKGDFAADMGVAGVVAKIYDREGNQINVPVYYFQEDGPPDPGLQATTEDGSFLIVNLNPGLYYLRAEKEGFDFPVCLFNVFADGVTFLEAEMELPTLYKWGGDEIQVLPGEISPSAQNVDMLRFNLWKEPESENIMVQSMTFTARGTLNLSNAVSSVKLYQTYDWYNFNLVGSGTINGNKIIFSNLNLEIWETGNPAKYLSLRFDFNGKASSGETIAVDLLSNSDIVAYGKESNQQAVCFGDPIIGRQTTIYAPQIPPEKPTNLYPTNGATGISATGYNLWATNFDSHGGNEQHLASHWQIRKIDESWETATLDEVTSQYLTQLPALVYLQANTTYCWRVRYQNGDFLWSEWSDPTFFTTGSNGILPPGKPENISPEKDEQGVSLTPGLVSSVFQAGSSNVHSRSQWQITTSAGNYQQPVFDSGPDSEHLTYIMIPQGYLQYNTTYYWHVRYQDGNGAWSDWSEETFFTTRSYQQGDINNDTYINVQDVILCLRMACRLQAPDLIRADVNGDEQVDIFDVVLVLKMTLGLVF